jgi:prepilin-type N-terminal cleavage/methylation domain-containing protein
MSRSEPERGERGLAAAGSRGGFTLAEVIVALTLLTVGLLLMAGAMATFVVQVRLADLQTERSAVRMQALERLRGTEFTSLSSKSSSSPDTITGYRVWWDVSTGGRDLRVLKVYTEGPGYAGGGEWTSAVRDTFQMQIARGRPAS